MLARPSLPDAPPRALIVEDEPALRDALRHTLQQVWPEMAVIGEAQSGGEALDMAERLRPDIAFLDIQMPGPDGMQVARMIGGLCHIVFVTAYDRFAVDAFEEGAIDYVLKPISAERLSITVNRLKQSWMKKPPDLLALFEKVLGADARPRYLRWISATIGKSLRLITTDEVVYFRADGKYTRVALAGSEVLIRKTLKELLQELDPEQFWQVHRSAIVNASEIAAIEPNMLGQTVVRLKSRRDELPISENFLKRFQQVG